VARPQEIVILKVFLPIGGGFLQAFYQYGLTTALFAPETAIII
jgi:hypothetical protein